MIEDSLIGSFPIDDYFVAPKTRRAFSVYINAVVAASD